MNNKFTSIKKIANRKVFIKKIARKICFILFISAPLVIFSSCPNLTQEEYITDAEAIRLDSSAIEIECVAGESKDSVTQDFQLPREGENGTIISWKSDNDIVTICSSILYNARAEVRQPDFDYPNNDTQVNLTATFQKGSKVKTKTIAITVKERVPTQEEAVSFIKNNLEKFIIFADGDDKNNVTKDFEIVSEFYTAKIEWASTDEETSNSDDDNGAIVISEKTGIVTKPKLGYRGNNKITLMALISCGELLDEQTIDLTVKRELTDRQAVDEALENLEDLVDELNEQEIDNIISDITLPTASPPNNCSVSWTSIPVDWVSTDTGSLGQVIKRPKFNHGSIADQDVTLRATITKGDEEGTKDIVIVIKEEDPTDQEAVDAVWNDFNALTDKITYASEDSKDSVTKGLSLKKFTSNEMYGTTITWETSNVDVISVSESTGSVTRPAYSSGDAEVSLRVTVTKNSATSGPHIVETVRVIKALNTANEMTSFSIENSESVVFVNDEITITMPNNSDISAMVPSFTLSDNAIVKIGGVEQTSGSTVVNFTDGVAKEYVVTSESGATKTYRVTVNVAKNTAKDITSFSFTATDNAALNADVTGILESGTVSISVPWGTSVTSLNPTIAVSAEASISPTSGIPQDFTSPVTYTVTAEDGSTQNYSVTVNVADITDDVAVAEAVKNLQALGDAAISYQESDNKNSVTKNINLATTSGFVNYGTTIAWSSNNSYIDNNGTVTRPDFAHGSENDQMVTLTATISKGAESDNSTSFTLRVIEAEPTDQEAVDAVWNDFNVLTDKITYASEDSKDSVTKGLSLKKFTSNEMYGTTITWETSNVDVISVSESTGSVTRPAYSSGDAEVSLRVTVTKNSATSGPHIVETVRVIKALNTANEMTSFSIDDSESIVFVNDEITVTMPNNYDISALIPSFTLSDNAIVKIGGVEQTSGSTVVNFTDGVAKEYVVTSESGATKTYRVTVNVAKNTAKNIISFSFGATNNAALNADVTGTLGNGTVSISVPWGTSVTSLNPTIEVSDEASISPTSGIPRDFTSPFTYTVIAEDGSTQNYSVTVNVADITDDVAVAEAVKNLQALGDAAISYKDSDDKNSVTKNINLATTSDFVNYGTSISWSSNSSSYISDDNNGTVTRPNFIHGSVNDQMVTLTAKISKGSVSDNSTSFTLKVIEAEPTDQEAVNAVWYDFNALTDKITYASEDSKDSVTKDLSLKKFTDNEMYGTTITWETSNEDVISVSGSTGSVTRPAYSLGHADVSLRVTVTKNSATSGSRTVETVKVIKAPNTANEMTDFAIAESEASSVNGTTITITMPNNYNISALVPSFTLSDNAIVKVGGVKQISGSTAVNFTDGVAKKYVVTSASGDEHYYEVTVNVAKNTAKDITSFSFTAANNAALDADVTGTLGNGTVSISVPWGTSVTSLNPTIEVSDEASIKPTSGTTRDFTNPVNYTVTAEDASIKNYSVTVNVEDITDDVAVAEAVKNLQALGDAAISYKDSDDKNSVTKNINLATTSDFVNYGTTISWSSNSSSYISDDNNGTVTRPNFIHGSANDKTVTLTAKISKGSVSDNSTSFTLRVIEEEPTDQEAVDAVASEARVTYSSTDYTDGQTIEGVTGNLTLSPEVGADSYSYGTTIAWTSSDDNASDNNGAVVVSGTTGTVTRPVWDVNRTSGYESISLTATVSKDGATATKTITLQVTQADAGTVASGEIGGVTAPVGGATAATSVTATSGYTGTIEWNPAHSTFKGSTVYTATVSLTAKSGYSFDSTSSSGWSIGGESASYSKTNSTHAQVSVTFPETKSDAKEITSFSFTAGSNDALSETATGTVDSGTVDSGTVSISVPWGTSLTSLNPTIVVSAEAGINPTSGTPRDFTSPVAYTVTAEDGSIKTWTVTVTVLAITDEQAVAKAKNNIAISYAAGDSATSVTQDITLPTSGDHDTTISWASNNDAITINHNIGTVARNIWEQKVVLAATITKDEESDTKEFNLTIPKEYTVINLDQYSDTDECDYSVSISNDGKRLAIGDKYYDSGGGMVSIYELKENILEFELDKFDEDGVGEGSSEDSKLGTSVAISGDGNTIVAGEPYDLLENNKNYGKLNFYDYENGEDIQTFAYSDSEAYSQSTSVTDTEVFDLGGCVATNNDATYIVAACKTYEKNDISGEGESSILVMEKDGASISLVKGFISMSSENYFSDRSIAVSNSDDPLVFAYAESTTGKVNFAKLEGNVFSECPNIGSLDSTGTEDNTVNIDISGDGNTVVIGRDDKVKVARFEIEGFVAVWKPSEIASFDNNALSPRVVISTDGKTIIASDSKYEVYVYHSNSDNKWSCIGIINYSDVGLSEGDYFGTALSLSDTGIVIVATNAYKVYAFKVPMAQN